MPEQQPPQQTPTEAQLTAFMRQRHDPDGGFYLADLANFLNGNIKVEDDRVIFDLQLPKDQMVSVDGSADARCLLPEHRLANELIPMLVFIDTRKVREASAAPVRTGHAG